jgi:hypothetical protein
MIKPKRSIIPRKPAPELAQALAIREQRRTPTIQEQCREIHERVEYLRAATYLLLLRQRY